MYLVARALTPEGERWISTRSIDPTGDPDFLQRDLSRVLDTSARSPLVLEVGHRLVVWGSR